MYPTVQIQLPEPLETKGETERDVYFQLFRVFGYTSGGLSEFGSGYDVKCFFRPDGSGDLAWPSLPHLLKTASCKLW